MKIYQVARLEKFMVFRRFMSIAEKKTEINAKMKERLHR